MAGEWRNELKNIEQFCDYKRLKIKELEEKFNNMTGDEKIDFLVNHYICTEINKIFL